MSLRTNNPAVLPKLNRRRALFVLSKIDAILAWEQRVDGERDTRFVELGHYLCEVRAGQYWRGGDMKGLGRVLQRAVPQLRTKNSFLIFLHQHLPPRPSPELRQR